MRLATLPEAQVFTDLAALPLLAVLVGVTIYLTLQYLEQAYTEGDE